MFQDNNQVNPKKLFIGNLPWSTTEDDLRQVFAEFGEIVEIRLITDKMSGRSKGIAFVEFATEEEAQAAIAGTQNLELDGRTVNVSVARPPRPREDRGFGGGDRRSSGGFGGGSRGGYNNDRRGGSGGGFSRDRFSRDDRRSS